jgi:hypothetical protein
VCGQVQWLDSKPCGPQLPHLSKGVLVECLLPNSLRSSCGPPSPGVRQCYHFTAGKTQIERLSHQLKATLLIGGGCESTLLPRSQRMSCFIFRSMTQKEDDYQNSQSVTLRAKCGKG